MVKGAITQDLEQGVVEEAPARVKILLNQARFEQITNEHMSNNQLLKYSLIGMKLWSMGGTLQTAHSTSTSSLVTHSLSRGGERTLCRFTRSLKFCRPEAQSTDCVRGRKSYSRYQVLLMCFAEPLSFRRGIHAWGFRWPKAKGERGTHAVVGVANNEQVRLVLSKN